MNERFLQVPLGQACAAARNTQHVHVFQRPVLRGSAEEELMLPSVTLDRVTHQ